MTNDTDDKPGGEAQQDENADAEQDRPTVAPPFDPVAFAQEVLGGRPSPLAGTPAVTPAGTKTEPARSPHGPQARQTPRGFARARMPTLTDPDELEEARLRSLTVPPGAARPTPQGLLSMANARVPSNVPPRAEPTFDYADDDRDDVATSPPPPLQQELIDSLASATPRPRPAPAGKPTPAAAAPAAAPPAPPPPPAEPSAEEMNDRVALGDYSGGLEMAERLLAIDPRDAAATACAESCRGVLRKMYAARIGPLDRVPIVMVSRDQLRWLSIDHRAGFVLSLVDGVSSLEMILDVSGMPELDALRILSELAQQRIVSFR